MNRRRVKIEPQSTITFHGGIGTIGGTKIIIQQGKYRVLFDFGLHYEPGGDFFGDRLLPRPGAARFRDLVRLGYVPAIDGLYRSDCANSTGLAPATDDRTQLFISHLHLDHMAAVDLVGDTVPVWMHADSLRLFHAVAETGEPPAVPVGARPFEWHRPITVGSIQVTPLPVDHDILGASALLIETAEGAVVYSGDLRLHGGHPELTDTFVAAARKAKPRLLLMEGTRMGQPERGPNLPPARRETEIASTVVEALTGSSALGMITLYPRNTRRIEAIAKALGLIDRRLLLPVDTVHLYQAMGGDLSQVLLYQREKDRLALQSGDAPQWLQSLFAGQIEVRTAEQVRREPQCYLLQLHYSDLGELVDLEPGPGSLFLHSNGEPLGKFDPQFELFRRWLDHFGIQLLFASSSGHAPAAHLKQVVEQIQPGILVPIHSHHPELMELAGLPRLLPELGATYEIASGARIR